MVEYNLQLTNSGYLEAQCTRQAEDETTDGGISMINETLIIVGPGGIGKSPLDGIVKSDAMRVDPYRLRKEPRDPDKKGEKDLFYAYRKLRDQLYLTYQHLGLGLTCLSPCVHWFSQSMTLFLKVRKDWQLLFLVGLDAAIGKAEIYAPVIPILLEIPQIRHVFGRLSMVLLNPVDNLAKLKSLESLKEETGKNCKLRGDKPESINDRIRSIDDEVPAWLEMLKLGATEYSNWQYAEHVYQTGDKKLKLIEARKTLIEKNPRLEIFFKTEEEIRRDQ